ncbi:MAG: hypothetical protein ACE5JA_08315 [bacterium]
MCDEKTRSQSEETQAEGADQKKGEGSGTGCCGFWFEQAACGESSQESAEKRQDFMSSLMAEMCGANMQGMMARCFGIRSAQGAPAETGRKDEE